MNESYSTMNGTTVTIPFHGDTLFAVETDDGIFVAIKAIAERLGLAWNKQLERIKRDPVLVEGMTVTVIPSVGGAQETTLLRLDLVNGWLFGIDVGRVKAEIRDTILRYKRECYRVLFDHFYGKASHAAASPPHHPVASLALTPEEVRSYVSLINAGRRTYGVRAAHFLWQQTPLPQIPHDMIDVTVRGLTADEVWGHCRTARSFDDAYWRLRKTGVSPQEAGAWAKWAMSCHEAQAQAQKSATARCGTAADVEDLF